MSRCKHSMQSWYIDKATGRRGCSDCDDDARATDPHEGLDFLCAICEGGNGGQVCDTCADHVPNFKRWVAATTAPHQGVSRFILVHKNKRGTMEPMPARTLYYPDWESAQERLTEMGADAERYEIREILVTFKG